MRTLHTKEKGVVASLIKSKEQIENELEENLEWMELPGKRASRIKISRAADIEDNAKGGDYYSWIVEQGEKFQSVFQKYIQRSQT